MGWNKLLRYNNDVYFIMFLICIYRCNKWRREIYRVLFQQRVKHVDQLELSVIMTGNILNLFGFFHTEAMSHTSCNFKNEHFVLCHHVTIEDMRSIWESRCRLMWNVLLWQWKVVLWQCHKHATVYFNPFIMTKNNPKSKHIHYLTYN
jgi:hypothetical protein